MRVAGAAQQGVLEVQGADGRWFGGIQLCLPAPPGDASDSEELLKELEAAVSSVACRQLGFPGGRALSAYPAGGSGADAVAGPTLRALLLCGGNETSVDQVGVGDQCVEGWRKASSSSSSSSSSSRGMAGIQGWRWNDRSEDCKLLARQSFNPPCRPPVHAAVRPGRKRVQPRSG